MIATVLPTYNRAPLAFERGAGSWLVTGDGQRYLDLGAGIAVNALGHAHPALIAALTDQAARLWHVSNIYTVPEQQDLADLLVAETFADTVFFTNSGTEAAELAIKMARKFHHDAGQPDRVGIIAVEGAFHGRSTGAIAAAGSEKMITDQTCAVMIEPVQGEGGIRVVPDQCLKGLRDLCDQTGTLLIFDEVQCGMGRTGRLFAHEWAGVSPDIMMVAKGIGGGFPLGAVLATERAASGMTVGTHGSTYGGNPLGCAVGAAVTKIIADPAFLAEVARKGALFRQGLESLVARHPQVFEGVRGEGLMLGLRCKPAPADVVKAGYDAGILTVAAADNVLRLLPALNIPDDDIAEALRRLDQTAASLTKAA
ncbi:MAG: acetylornithine transaminase [Rhodobacterales bacterium 12-65-15]|nr:MAG: acetylornithine transaminase [Rhodobacterales bacterium 12-65-15]